MIRYTKVQCVAYRKKEEPFSRDEREQKGSYCLRFCLCKYCFYMCILKNSESLGLFSLNNFVRGIKAALKMTLVEESVRNSGLLMGLVLLGICFSSRSNLIAYGALTRCSGLATAYIQAVKEKRNCGSKAFAINCSLAENAPNFTTALAGKPPWRVCVLRDIHFDLRLRNLDLWPPDSFMNLRTLCVPEK